MCNDDELEIRLLLPSPDDVVQGLGERSYIVAVQIRGRLVQCYKPTFDTKALGQCQSDDDACKHSLPSATSPTHVHFRVLLDHPHSIVVRSIPPGFLVVGPDEDCINICSLIRSLPEFLRDAIYLLHLETVVLHYCSAPTSIPSKKNKGIGVDTYLSRALPYRPRSSTAALVVCKF